MKLAAKKDWTLVDQFPDLVSAGAFVARLQADGVPAEIRADTSLLGEFRLADVVVPAHLAHRARWVISQWQVSEAELIRQAVGGDEDDQEPVPEHMGLPDSGEFP